VSKRHEAGKSVTKRHGAVTRPAAMSAADRQRKHRAAKAKARPVTSADEVFQSIIETRHLSSAVDRAVAQAATDALVAGDLSEAVRALALLPAPRAETAASSVSASGARERFLQLALNNIAAHRIELAARAERGPLDERDALLLRLHEIDQQALLSDESDDEPDQPSEREQALLAEIARLRLRLGEAPPPPDQATTALSTERVIVPPTGDIVPPGEIGELRRTNTTKKRVN
jgi:hypothetical protein